MTKASSLLVLVLFAAMTSQVSAQIQYRPGQGQVRPGQQEQIISERVYQHLGPREIRRVSELLRLSMSESMELEASEITLLAASIRSQALIEISSRGRLLQTLTIRKKLTEVRLQLPAATRLEDLEISANEEILLDTVSARVSQERGQGGRELPQVASGQAVKLELREDIRLSGEINLKQLVKRQFGLSIEGAQIERIAVQGQVLRGRSATVQVEMNKRVIGPVKTLSAAQAVTPIPLNTIEEVTGSLKLHVRGDVMITQILIRVGQVRPLPQHQEPRVERIHVSQQISAGRPLELSALLPYESRLISSITLEARAAHHGSAEVALMALGQVMGSAIVTQVPMRPMIQLHRPMSVRELRLQSLSPVIIEALEVVFDSIRY